MTQQSRATCDLLLEKYVAKRAGGNRWSMHVENDLFAEFAKGTGFVPITDPHGNLNVGVWCRCHGSEYGSLFLDDKEIDPKTIREMVAERWSKQEPILLTCCYPAAAQERWGKELRKYNIVIFDKYLDEPIYASDPANGGSYATIWTEREQQRMLQSEERG